MAPAAWTTKAIAERKRVIDAYKKFKKELKLNKDLRFKFKYEAYGEDVLREALNKAYGYKCAYCELFIGAGGPTAVEHYRPKGEITEGKTRIRPGYYWLASTWENLLPSCTDCNSSRGHEMEVGEKKVVRGKANSFPLEPGSKRARSPGREKLERPLLLNPEIDDPEKHLEFLTERDRAGVIRAALLNGQPSAKGVASIDVYALDRPQLIRARADFAEHLFSHIRNTVNSERRHRALPNDPALKLEYDQNVADLFDVYLSPRKPYSAMARQIARAELPGLNLYARR